VDPAGPHTWPVRAFRTLASGPFRTNMLGFFKVSGDFTKRLVSVKANGKFSSPDSEGSHHPWFAESEDFRSVIDNIRLQYGVQYVYCWHAFGAYWGGVVPSSGEFSDLNARIVYPEPTQGVCPSHFELAMVMFTQLQTRCF
jgi:raffinose synthase